MLAATSAIGCLSGAVRHVSVHIHPFEITFFRSLFALVPLLPWFFAHGIAPLKTQRAPLFAVRGVINVVAMMLFYYALSISPLAQITALAFVAPLFATLFAIPLLREQVRARRWIALACGFGGTLIILRPGVQTIDAGSIMAVASAATWALGFILMKILARTESSVTIAAYAALTQALLSLLPAAFVWSWPSGEDWLWLIGIGTIGGLAQVGIAQALKLADATAVLPLDFTKLVWAAIVGYLFFSETPGMWTWIGGAVIFASATYVGVRESRAKEPSPRTKK
jgi:drug/metabolite transporter (DMT)-like permease